MQCCLINGTTLQGLLFIAVEATCPTVQLDRQEGFNPWHLPDPFPGSNQGQAVNLPIHTALQDDVAN